MPSEILQRIGVTETTLVNNLKNNRNIDYNGKQISSLCQCATLLEKNPE